MGEEVLGCVEVALEEVTRLSVWMVVWSIALEVTWLNFAAASL